ncbi:unnamed protein product [Soboliphyme baturini]|uniref:Uncharacterized protein n=1 Tax=Soboliphyme baturini TaxID=241478 RepID=A0A183IGG2_9BILA|nr:unnamed protein product [Soboliphyme baturini]
MGGKDPSTERRFEEAGKAAVKAAAKTKVDSWEKLGEVLESNFHMASKVFWETIRRHRDESLALGVSTWSVILISGTAFVRWLRHVLLMPPEKKAKQLVLAQLTGKRQIDGKD